MTWEKWISLWYQHILRNDIYAHLRRLRAHLHVHLFEASTTKNHRIPHSARASLINVPGQATIEAITSTTLSYKYASVTYMYVHMCIMHRAYLFLAKRQVYWEFRPKFNNKPKHVASVYSKRLPHTEVYLLRYVLSVLNTLAAIFVFISCAMTH